MSNFLEDARADLKALLQTDASLANVYDYRPEGATPPMVFVEAQDPYLEPGATFSDWKIYLSILVIGPKATNAQATKDVDNRIAAVIEAVRGEWTVQSVSAGITTLNNLDYATGVIKVTNQLNN